MSESASIERLLTSLANRVSEWEFMHDGVWGPGTEEELRNFAERMSIFSDAKGIASEVMRQMWKEINILRAERMLCIAALRMCQVELDVILKRESAALDAAKEVLDQRDKADAAKQAAAYRVGQEKMRGRAAEAVMRRAVETGRAECCGYGVGSPPDCCGSPAYRFLDYEAEQAILDLAPEPADAACEHHHDVCAEVLQ